jgi:hypothetical protein
VAEVEETLSLTQASRMWAKPTNDRLSRSSRATMTWSPGGFPRQAPYPRSARTAAFCPTSPGR